MNFKEPFSRFFDHPACRQNWLLLTVCFLIPVVGPMVALGWTLRCFVAWLDERPEPPFDFQHFGDYLKEGLWPTLVSMVIMFTSMIILVPIFILAFVALLNEGPSGPDGLTFLIMFAGVLILQFIVFAIIGLLATPATINSGLRQNFAAGFSLSFIVDFLKRCWWPLLYSQIALMIMWFVGILLGYMALIVGVYFVYAIMFFVSWHLHFQVYRHYLAKGGTEIPIAPNLIPPSPPELPPAAETPPLPTEAS